MALRTWNQTAIIKYLQTAFKNAEFFIQKGYNQAPLSHFDSRADFILHPNLTYATAAKFGRKQTNLRNHSLTTSTIKDPVSPQEAERTHQNVSGQCQETGIQNDLQCNTVKPDCKAEYYTAKHSRSAFYEQNETASPFLGTDATICKNNFSTWNSFRTFANRKSPKLNRIKRLGKDKDSDALTFNKFKQNTIAKRNELHKKVSANCSKIDEKQNSVSDPHNASNSLKSDTKVLQPQELTTENNVLNNEKESVEFRMNKNKHTAESNLSEMEEFLESFTKKIEEKIRAERQKLNQSKIKSPLTDCEKLTKKQCAFNPKNPNKTGVKHIKVTDKETLVPLSMKSNKKSTQNKQKILETPNSKIKDPKNISDSFKNQTGDLNKADETSLQNSKKLDTKLKKNMTANKPIEDSTISHNEPLVKCPAYTVAEKRRKIIWYEKFPPENVKNIPEKVDTINQNIETAKENDSVPNEEHVEIINFKTHTKEDIQVEPNKVDKTTEEVAIKVKSPLEATGTKPKDIDVNDANIKNQNDVKMCEAELNKIENNKMEDKREVTNPNQLQNETSKMRFGNQLVREEPNKNHNNVVEVVTSQKYKNELEIIQSETPKDNVNIDNFKRVQVKSKSCPNIPESSRVCLGANELRKNDIKASSTSKVSNHKIPPFENIEGNENFTESVKHTIAKDNNLQLVKKELKAGTADEHFKDTKIKTGLSKGKKILAPPKNRDNSKETRMRLNKKRNEETLPTSARKCTKRKKKNGISVNIDTFCSPEMEQRKRMEFRRSNDKLLSNTNLSGMSYIPKRKMCYLCCEERNRSLLSGSQIIKSKLPQLTKHAKYMTGANTKYNCDTNHIIARSLHMTPFLETRTVVKKIVAKKSLCRIPLQCKMECTPPNPPKRKQCVKVMAPYKSFTDMNCLDNYNKPTECPSYIELQPSKPVFSQLEKIPVPEHMVLDPEFEEDCVLRKMNQKRSGTTVFCSTNFKKPVLRQLEILKVDRHKMCRYFSGKSSKDCANINSDGGDCEVFHRISDIDCKLKQSDCRDLKDATIITCASISEINCPTEEPKMLPKENCDCIFQGETDELNECANSVSKNDICSNKRTNSKADVGSSTFSTPCVPQQAGVTYPQERINVECCRSQCSCNLQATPSSCEANKPILQRLIDYFKARPNCPSPNEWKRKMLREKAEKAAKAAGLSLCDPDPCKTTFKRPYSTFKQPRTYLAIHQARSYSTSKKPGRVCKVNRLPCGPKPKVSLEEKPLPKFNNQTPLCGKTRPRCSTDEMVMTSKCSAPRYASCPLKVSRQTCIVPPYLENDCCSIRTPFPSFSECYRQFPRLHRHECQAQKLMVTKQKEAIKNIFRSTWIED